MCSSTTRRPSRPRRASTRRSPDILVDGRPGHVGPLCHVLVDRNGEAWVVAAGRASHAGRADASGPLPEGDGDAVFVGVEVEYAATTTSPRSTRRICRSRTRSSPQRRSSLAWVETSTTCVPTARRARPAPSTPTTGTWSRSWTRCARPSSAPDASPRGSHARQDAAPAPPRGGRCPVSRRPRVVADVVRAAGEVAGVGAEVGDAVVHVARGVGLLVEPELGVVGVGRLLEEDRVVARVDEEVAGLEVGPRDAEAVGRRRQGRGVGALSRWGRARGPSRRSPSSHAASCRSPSGPVAVPVWLYWTLRSIQFWARAMTSARLMGSLGAALCREGRAGREDCGREHRGRERCSAGRRGGWVGSSWVSPCRFWCAAPRRPVDRHDAEASGPASEVLATRHDSTPR